MTLIENVQVDVAIVGGGLVGLAVAENVSRSNPALTVALFERHPSFGQETSSRHSEVVHAGIYYPPGSLKATLCRRGRELLYSFCEKYGIKFDRCGKYVVATSENQLEALNRIWDIAARNGVELVRLRSEFAKMELGNPGVVEALWSPCSGIADSHGVMACLLRLADANGCIAQFSSEVDQIIDVGDRISFAVRCGGERFHVTSRVFVNCAGLGAARIHRMFDPDSDFEIRPCRGRYFLLSSSWTGKFRHLVYPLPDPAGGLGIHLTVDLSGEGRLGPDVDWACQGAEPDDLGLYQFGNDTEKLADKFWEAGVQIIPGLRRTDLRPGYIGVRPKLFAGGQPRADFLIETSGEKARHIHLLGIESPGFTSCLALAEEVGNIVTSVI